MSVPVSPSIPTWLLLDVPVCPGLLDRLRYQHPESRCFRLFESTDFQRLSEQGPILVLLESDSRLWVETHTRPDAWPGIFMASQSEVEPLLGHLRRMLRVRFAEHEGLLSYYSPQTASYFFDACDAEELGCWMGPISLLSWYGGTWADKAEGCLGWQQLRNPRLSMASLPERAPLSLKQQGRLQECILGRHAYRWSRSSGHAYTLIWRYLQEGLHCGFNDSAVLDAWLQLRVKHPGALIPLNLEGLACGERLDFIRRSWQAPPL